MKPHRLVAETRTPEGAMLTLHEHDSSFCVRLAGRELMHSRAAASEEALGEIGTALLPGDRPVRVLVGGLGLGFTLRAALAQAGPKATVEVAELIPAIVSWNREHLGALNGALLDDPRVTVSIGDVAVRIRTAPRGFYDAILLDVDNGPVAMVQAGNAALYGLRGLAAVAAALAPGGRVVVWSAGEDRAFERRLAQAGFRVETVAVKVHAGARQSAGRLFVGDKVSPKAK